MGKLARTLQNPPMRMHPKLRLRLAYVSAVVLPAFAFLVRYALADALGWAELLITFLPAVAISALLGGAVPGLLATAISAAAVHLSLSGDAVGESSVGSTMALATGVFGMGLCVLGETLRRSERRLRESLRAAHAAADERRASEERFSVVFHFAPSAILIERCADGRIVDVNHAFTQLWGYTQEQALGCTATELRLWAEPGQVVRAGHTDAPFDAESVQIRRRSGDTREALVAVRRIGYLGAPHLLVMAADVTERTHARELEHMAHHDTLTDLPNRLLLHERLREAIARTSAGSAPSAVLFIDLDRFKQVNDAYGHRAGDELLRLVAARLKTRLRATDTLARVGGDEFVVLLEILPDLAEAERIAADLIRAMCMPFVLARGYEVQIGASVGVSFFSPGDRDVEMLIGQADAALYAAKAAGRNTYRVFYAEAKIA